MQWRLLDANEMTATPTPSVVFADPNRLSGQVWLEPATRRDADHVSDTALAVLDLLREHWPAGRDLRATVTLAVEPGPQRKLRHFRPTSGAPDNVRSLCEQNVAPESVGVIDVKLSGIDASVITVGYVFGEADCWQVRADLHDGDHEDAAIGETMLELFDLACRTSTAVVGGRAHGQVYFGRYGREPYTFASPAPLRGEQVDGYSWLLVLDDRRLALLGDPEGIPDGVVEASRMGTTRTGEKYAIGCVHRAPGKVRLEALRRWKEFLGPLVPPKPQREFGPHGLTPALAALPPMVLPEDWP